MFRNDQPEVSLFLKKYPFLVTVLTEAHRNIMKYFPNNPPVYLAVSTDPEGLEDDQLVASIATDLDVEEAADALDAFDEQWWFNSSNLAQDKLGITVEFL